MSNNDHEVSDCNHLWLPWVYNSHIVTLDGKGGRSSESVFTKDCAHCPTTQEHKFPTGTDPNLDDDFG